VYRVVLFRGRPGNSLSLCLMEAAKEERGGLEQRVDDIILSTGVSKLMKPARAHTGRDISVW